MMGFLVTPHNCDRTFLAESCTDTFVAAKTLPRYLSFRENFANGGVPALLGEVSYNTDFYVLAHRASPLPCGTN